MCQVIAAASNRRRILSHVGSPIPKAQYNKVIHTSDTETTLVCRGIALCSRKLRMYSPKTLCVMSHSYSEGEAFNHAAADKSRNGVVGNIGRNIPVTPSANEIEPTIIKNTFIARQLKF